MQDSVRARGGNHVSAFEGFEQSHESPRWAVANLKQFSAIGGRLAIRVLLEDVWRVFSSCVFFGTVEDTGCALRRAQSSGIGSRVSVRNDSS